MTDSVGNGTPTVSAFVVANSRIVLSYTLHRPTGTGELPFKMDGRGPDTPFNLRRIIMCRASVGNYFDSVSMIISRKAATRSAEVLPPLCCMDGRLGTCRFGATELDR